MPAGFAAIAGLKIGHAQWVSEALPSENAIGAGTSSALGAGTGCTVLLAEGGPSQTPLGTAPSGILLRTGMVAACDARGGAIGERELETLRPSHLVERIHALVFAGGSAFGLEAAAGVMRWCEERGIGFDTGVARVPIVPAAILFDLRLGDRARRPDAAMGYAAAEAAAQAEAEAPVAEGNVGAGAGCSVGKLFGIARATKAGIGCWSEDVVVPGGESVRVSALAAVNAFGDIRDPNTGRIIAGARKEKGSLEFADTAAMMRHGTLRTGFADPSTVLVAVATTAALSRIEAQRLAMMASAGVARVISPAHTTFDGDVVFALSLGSAGADINALGAAAAEAVARAIVRGVTQARSACGLPGLLDWSR